MNIISHHAVNNHYSNINNNQKGRSYIKQTGATLDGSAANKMVVSSQYLTTADDYTSRNAPLHTLDNRLNSLSSHRNHKHISIVSNLNNKSTDDMMSQHQFTNRASEYKLNFDNTQKHQALDNFVDRSAKPVNRSDLRSVHRSPLMKNGMAVMAANKSTLLMARPGFGEQAQGSYSGRPSY